MLQLEFTVEPVAEEQPGAHMVAAVEAVESRGGAVEVRPSGSVCRAPADEMPGIVAAVIHAAFANGASHVNVHVARLGDGPAAVELPGGAPS